MFKLTILFLTISSNMGINGLPHLRRIQLFNGEESVMMSLQNHIKREELIIQDLERQLGHLSSVVSGRGARDEYLNNPLHTVTLVRRLTTDWIILSKLIHDPLVFSPWLERWATSQHVEASVRSLCLLQLTYNLSTDHLANGVLAGSPTGAIISGADCFAIALTFYRNQEYDHAVEWLDQVLSKHDNVVPRATVLELYYLSKCLSGDIGASSLALKSLLASYPSFEPSESLINDWELVATKTCEEASYVMEDRYESDENKTLPSISFDLHSWLCQGNQTPQPGLKCRYVHYNKTHLRLAPFRLEELQIDPPVILFHNVIHEVEIQEAKRMSWLQPSRTLSEKGVSRMTYHRTSEVAWIFREESKILDLLEKRMAEVTNLDVSEAEAHQVARYSLGGEYTFHNDYLTVLNEVPQGGHTVFKEWRLSVKPQKGSALLWFNIYRNGSQDTSAIHAACPVLEGNKWVLNKWFHEANNEFKAPCLPNDENSFKEFYL